jgi:hypothetical protein
LREQEDRQDRFRFGREADGQPGLEDEKILTDVAALRIYGVWARREIRTGTGSVIIGVLYAS